MGEPIGRRFSVLKGHCSSRAIEIRTKVLPLLILQVIACAIVSFAAPPNPYPNELIRLRFYAKYMAPLRPNISDLKTVVRVMGSDEGLQLKDWRILPLYSCPDPTTTCPAANRLASIDVSPKHRVSMLGVKFSPAFKHSSGGVSEINVTCDVYKDDFGLEYWIYSADFASGKKGDLLEIVYGPNKQIEQKAKSSQ